MPAPDLFHSWTAIRDQLRNAVDESTWDLWLSALEARSLDGDTLVLEAPAQSRGWVRDRYGRLLDACATAALGRPITVVVSTPEERPAAEPGSDGAAPVETTRGREGGVNPRLTFEQFVIGSSNRLAHAAALAVAEMPGLAYNPLFICGEPGLGKTHLLHSIANYAALHDERLSIRMTTAESFTNEFLGALHGGGDMDAFKTRHRSVDLLLVDDVQFLQSKARTEQEFFHLFNELHAGGAQIVLTSDRPPQDMHALEDRLRERFAAGLVCDVQAPDRDTRLTILRKRMLQDRIVLADEAALDVIADRVTDNIRALEGALIRVVAYASLTGRPVDAAIASEVLDKLYPEAPPAGKPSISAIQEAVSRHYGIDVAALLASTRAAGVAWPRHVAMHLARELTGESLPAIGAAFGGRSHTTVLHACRRARTRLAEDAAAAADVDKLLRVLRGQA
ncbi:MAG: Chromosomal replication initiator protein DnaA [uncultured Solirubrobacteraceae bacterium]|uniref:Chromosomal replication initiator protein DnaA n=1 Tax=uncultured Solirubrobacteraceae bacterium TaxID=1162706 RepID=A0A6J4RQS5_9ACTN|nr:MAG: Chromosomal replication initiator protein DnaA [uncultured Solirubrobacteraceae bacterium]